MTFRAAEHLTAAETRYLKFQLWQEGVARFIEYSLGAAYARCSISPSPAGSRCTSPHRLS
jgi:hypothetical protein